MKSAFGLVAAVFAISFVTMPASEYVGDAMAVRVQTITMINTGRFDVPADLTRTSGEPGQYFYENGNGRFYPKYGVLSTLIYVPCLWLEKLITGRLPSAQHTLFLNLFNVVVSCISAAYLVALARRYTASNVTVWIFVLASLYSTFWWNYCGLKRSRFTSRR